MAAAARRAVAAYSLGGLATDRDGGLWSNCGMEPGERLATDQRLLKGA
jgi:hypothetical protein